MYIITVLILIILFLFIMQIFYEGKLLSILENQDFEFEEIYDNQDYKFETDLQLLQINWMPLTYGFRSVTQCIKGKFDCKIYDTYLIISTSDNLGFRKHFKINKNDVKLKKDIFVGYYLKFRIESLNVSMKLLKQKDYIYFKNL